VPASRDLRLVRRHWPLLIAIALVLWGTTDDREVGLVADGRQMIFTAVALSETGSLGQARGRDLTIPQADGASVSRYGLGMSFAQVPAAALAPVVEARLGPATSQPLFLIVPFLLVLATAWLAAMGVRQLGGGLAAERAAILLATLASPVGAYVAFELSEPLQAFALTAGFVAALRARAADGRSSRRAAAMAGLFAGLAVLTKSSLLFVAPLALVPLLVTPGQRRARLVSAACAGFAPVAALWLYFEIARFGRPFAGYADEGFTHPFLDGAWRLLVGPNKGLLLYFPAAVAAGVLVWRALRSERLRAALLAGTILPFVALLLLAAPWWAWHGVDGWGPRLLVPGIPLLAMAAALEIERWRTPWRAGLIAVSVLLNVPPLLQHPTPVVRYMWVCAWPAVDAESAARVPEFARRERGGQTVVVPDQVLATVPAASPFVALPWFLQASRGDGAQIAARLNAPPWREARPGITPQPPMSPDEAVAIARPPRWNFWGRGFSPGAREHQVFAVYDAALIDQILRAQQLRQGDRALHLSRKLESLAPSGFADALLLESFRLLGQKPEAIDWLTHLPMERRQDPAINVVLALWDRDDGKEDEARALLRSSAGSYPGRVLQRALDAPLSAWPSDFASMTADPTLAVR
jgi:hypothetical protein